MQMMLEYVTSNNDQGWASGAEQQLIMQCRMQTQSLHLEAQLHICRSLEG